MLAMAPGAPGRYQANRKLKTSAIAFELLESQCVNDAFTTLLNHVGMEFMLAFVLKFHGLRTIRLSGLA